MFSTGILVNNNCVTVTDLTIGNQTKGLNWALYSDLNRTE